MHGRPLSILYGVFDSVLFTPRRCRKRMQNTKSIAVVLLLATPASALQTPSAKSRLKSLFAGRPNDALASRHPNLHCVWR